MPKDKPYLVDSDGNYLYLLAQLNFSQIPHLDGYPEKGLLQFYVAADDMYGLNFDDQTAQTNFRVVYFEDIAEPPLVGLYLHLTVKQLPCRKLFSFLPEGISFCIIDNPYLSFC